MRARTATAVLVVAVLISYVLIVLWWKNTQHRPYSTPPPRTVAEKRLVQQATKGIGRHVVIDGEHEIVIQMENGRTRTIRRTR